jgi:catechol 2,3-dioxygenase-like lactoylglutathione lyase family enzyme
MYSAGLSELVLIVSDVRRAAEFYRDVVGLVPEESTNWETWAWFWAGEPGRRQWLAVHKGSLLPVHGPVDFNPNGRRPPAQAYYFYDPDGNLVEFWSAKTPSSPGRG